MSETTRPKRIAVLGSTGSIGSQTMEVLDHLGNGYCVAALSASGRREEALTTQAIRHLPDAIHVADGDVGERLAQKLRDAHGWGGQLYLGDEGLQQLATEADADVFLLATVGWTGVEPALRILRRGKTLALANKEALVCAGNLLTSEAKKSGALILPVDSEHAAIAQCLAGRPKEEVERVVLTCSGGAYREASADQIRYGRSAATLRHPTWEMGQKITVDSATLMNKGFEVIEAHHLFGFSFDSIDVVIHPQSIVHSMVVFRDGSLLAQLGITDMRLPIQAVLTHPDRLRSLVEPLRFHDPLDLSFSAPDTERFPALRLGYEAGRLGDAACTVLNAANEVAVAAHLRDTIPCGSISDILQRCLKEFTGATASDFAALQALDREARGVAERLVAGEA